MNNFNENIQLFIYFKIEILIAHLQVLMGLSYNKKNRKFCRLSYNKKIENFALSQFDNFQLHQ